MRFSEAEDLLCNEGCTDPTGRHDMGCPAKSPAVGRVAEFVTELEAERDELASLLATAERKVSKLIASLEVSERLVLANEQGCRAFWRYLGNPDKAEEYTVAAREAGGG